MFRTLNVLPGADARGSTGKDEPSIVLDSQITDYVVTFECLVVVLALQRALPVVQRR